MRSPSPARRRSPRVAGLAGPMAERRHTGSRRLSACCVSLLIAGALGAHAAELARPTDADLRSAFPPATLGAASQTAPVAVAAAIAGFDRVLDQNAVCQGLAEAATPGGETAATADAALLPRSASAGGIAAGLPPAEDSAGAAPPAAAAAVARVALAAPVAPAATTPPPAPKPHPALGFDAAFGVPRRPFGKLIYQIARDYALNPLLVAAIATVESDFNPRARSRKGAYGLMQVLPSTARRFGLPRKRDLFNPRKNLETASRYLRWLVDRFGDDPIRVLAAYNAGEGAVDRFGGVPPFSETRDYVQRIFGLLGFSVLLDAPATAPAAAAAVALAGVAGAR